MKLFCIFIFSCYVLGIEKVRYISVERPAVNYYDKNMVTNVEMTTKRYGRRNPVYYVNINITVTVPFDNNIGFHFYFYEYLSNVYKRSFIEMHYKFCDFLEKDKFFGPAVKQNPCFAGPCPYPPGVIDLANMTIPPASIPASFPFMKGRIVLNITRFDKVFAFGHIDMEIKEFKKKDDSITFAKL